MTEQRSRLDAVRHALDEADLDAILIASTPARPGDGAYLTGHFPWARLAYVVLGVGDEAPSLFTTMESEAYWARAASWNVDVQLVAAEDLVRRVFNALGGEKARIGVSQLSTLIPAGDLDLLAKLAKNPLVDATAILASIRSVKTAAELRELEGASELGRAMLEDLSTAATADGPPASESSLFADAERAAKTAGARQTHFLTSDRAYLRPPRRDRTLGRGAQLVSLEFSNESGYWVEIGNTLVSDHAADPLGALAVCQEALRAVQAAMRPGRECHAVVADFLDVVAHTRWNPGIWLGHGIGLDTTEAPHLTSGNRQVILPGMVFAVHPHVVDDADAGAYMARTMVVEEGRTRVLGYES